MALSVGTVIVLRLTDAIRPPVGFLLMVVAMLPLIPFARSCVARQQSRGGASVAISNYTRRMLVASFGYMAGLGVAVTLHNRFELTGVIAFAVALLPVIPTLWMIWAMGRYLVEEQDEYLRYRAMLAALIGLGTVLSLGCFWGFLETFELVPHVPGWWAVPIWAIGMGAGQGWLALRDRREPSE